MIMGLLWKTSWMRRVCDMTMWTFTHTLSKNLLLLVRLTVLLCLDKLAFLKVTSIIQLIQLFDSAYEFTSPCSKLPFIRELFPWTLRQFHCNRLSKDTMPRTGNLTHIMHQEFLWVDSDTDHPHRELDMLNKASPHCPWTQAWLCGCFTRKSWYPASAVDLADGQLQMLLFVYFYIHLFATPTTWPLHLVGFHVSAETWYLSVLFDYFSGL